VLRIVEGFPRSFSRYALLTAFGRGGMGDVYLAKQRVGAGERLVVVKTLRGDLAADQEYVRRFLDEARVVTQLNHAHISTVYEAGVVGQDHYLTMEFIHGVNLKEFAAALRGPLEPGLALVVADGVLDALAYAHRLRSPTTQEPLHIVHRDVSPANVMIGFEGEVKLIDFGLAESALKTEHTETRVVMGKVAYMSPEQARGDDVDGACDQFAAAITLYELLTGDRFYGDMNNHQIWQVVGVGGFVPRSWQKVPPPLRLPLATALDKNPTARFADCDAFRAALDDVRAEHFPRSSPQKLRELVQGLYRDRIHDERQLIASFAHLEPPTHEVATDHAQPVVLPPPSATEPHFTSPSAPAPGPGPGHLAGATVSSRLEPSRPSSPSGPPPVSSSPPAAAPSSPGEATLATAVTNPAGRTFAALGGAVVLVGIVAVIAMRSSSSVEPPSVGVPPPPAVPSPPVVAPAPSPPPVVEVPPPPEVAPPPEVPSPPVVAPSSPSVRPKRPPPEVAPPVAPPPVEPSPPPATPPPVVAPPPPAPAPSAPAEMSVAEMEQAIRTCVVNPPAFVRTNALDPTRDMGFRLPILKKWGPRCAGR
jgi:serine/threonine-protein kinase